jgi:hypothetical protein
VKAPKLDWSQAEVEEGRLTVSLDGKLPKGWKGTFARTVKLLAGGSWGEVEVKKGRVRLGGITPGSEERVRHFLESVVEQANRAHLPREADGQKETAAGDEEPEGPDAEMTAVFRSFAD